MAGTRHGRDARATCGKRKRALLKKSSALFIRNTPLSSLVGFFPDRCYVNSSCTIVRLVAIHSGPTFTSIPESKESNSGGDLKPLGNLMSLVQLHERTRYRPFKPCLSGNYNVSNDRAVLDCRVSPG